MRPFAYAVETQSRNHVVKHIHRRKRIGPLKHHSNSAAHKLGLRGRTIDVEITEVDRAPYEPTRMIVKTVERAKKRRLATARWTHERRHLARWYAESHFANRYEIPE